MFATCKGPLSTPWMAAVFLIVTSPVDVPGQETRVEFPNARPVPRMQVIPLPDAQASIQRDGEELTRAHFGPSLRRPFLFPINGPSGRPLTRMGHPHDPEGHSHHNSVWVAHESVNGESFWNDRGTGRVVHRRIVRYEDGDPEASVVSSNAWVGKGDATLLTELRGVTIRPLEGRECLLILDLQFRTAKQAVTFGATPFGLPGVRMAKTVGVKDGGGLIRNSEGNSGEQGPDGVFRKRARWVDYSGPIARDVIEGITLFDHPANPNHPTHFHVRDDGWMGASLTTEVPITVGAGDVLRLRYGLYVHGGAPTASSLDERWVQFARAPIADLPAR